LAKYASEKRLRRRAQARGAAFRALPGFFVACLFLGVVVLGPGQAAAQGGGLWFEAQFGKPDEVVVRGQGGPVRLLSDRAGVRALKGAHHYLGPGGEPVELTEVADEVVVGYAGGAPSSQAVSAVPSRAAFALGQGRARLELDGTAAEACAQLAARPEVRFAYPVLYDLSIPGRVMPTDELVVCTMPGADIQGVAARHGVAVLYPLWAAENQWIVALTEPKVQSPLDVANAISADPEVLWAEPDFIVEGRKAVNDPLFGNEWHLESTGQNISGKMPLNDNDVDAESAWAQLSAPYPTVVAIVDDGVQTNHPDLQNNIFVNTAESGGSPGIDDDGNGYVDDINGWNFVGGNNNPNPADAEDSHGTAVAGVAVAVGNNGTGVAGAAYAAKILPVKMASGSSYATDSQLASAFRYAGSFAHVINFSWSWGSSTTVRSGIRDAREAGALLFAAAGNGYGWGAYQLSGFPTGSFTHRWQYQKNANTSSGQDTAWLDLVQFPDGVLENFDGVTAPALPGGWTTGGNANWTTVASPADLSPTRPNVAKAGTITHSQSTYLQVAHNNATAGNLLFVIRPSSQSGFDGVQYFADGNPYFDLISGVPPSSVAYPAYYDEVVCVGALNSDAFRSYYSQVGAPLDFVAPSGGTFMQLGIETTDRTGTDGYNTNSGTAGDYCRAGDDTGFSGTSSATPLASGVAALVRAANTGLSPTQVRNILRETGNKVDSAVNPYAGRQTGRNDNLGYGRVNAHDAVIAAQSTPTPATLASSVKIVELADDPAGLEFIEIYNFSTTTACALNNLALTDNETTNDVAEGACRFPEGYSIPPRGLVVVVVGTGATQAFVDEVTANATGPYGPAGGAQMFETVNSGLSFGGTAIPNMEIPGGVDPDLTDSDNAMLVITDGYEITFLNEVLDGLVYGAATLTANSSFGVAPGISESATYASNTGLTTGFSLQRRYPYTDINDSLPDFRLMTLTPGMLPPPSTVDAHSSPQPDRDLPGWNDTEPEKMSVLTFRVTDHGSDGLATLIDRVAIGISGTAGDAANDIAWAELRDASARVALAASISNTEIVFGAAPNGDSAAQLDAVSDNAFVEYTVYIYLNTVLLGQHDETYVFDVDETRVGADGGNSTPMGPDSGAVVPVTGTLVIAALGITVTPDTWNIGPKPLNYAGESGSFVVQNTGNVAENFSIEGENASGGWTLQSAVGLNAFKVEADRGDNGSYETVLSTSEQPFATNVAVSATETLGLRYSSPSSDSLGAGMAQDFTITLKASVYAP